MGAENGVCCPECKYLTKEKDILVDHASEVHFERYSKSIEQPQGYVIRKNELVKVSDFDIDMQDVETNDESSHEDRLEQTEKETVLNNLNSFIDPKTGLLEFEDVKIEEIVEDVNIVSDIEMQDEPTDECETDIGGAENKTVQGCEEKCFLCDLSIEKDSFVQHLTDVHNDKVKIRNTSLIGPKNGLMRHEADKQKASIMKRKPKRLTATRSSRSSLYGGSREKT